MKLTRVAMAVTLTFGFASVAEPCAASSPAISIANAPVVPGEPLLVDVMCAKGTGAADVRSPVITYTVLDLQADGRWHASPTIERHARAGDYVLTARCTPGPSSPYATSTAAFHVSKTSQHWSATSSTARAITGDVNFTPESLAFDGGQNVAIHYLKSVSGHVSFVGDAYRNSRAQLYRITSSADPTLRSGNRFCGQRPTFISLMRVRSVKGTDAFLTVYSGATEPRGTSSDHLCAGYTYTL